MIADAHVVTQRNSARGMQTITNWPHLINLARKAPLYLQYPIFCVAVTGPSIVCMQPVLYDKWNAWEWSYRDRQMNRRVDIAHAMSLFLSLYWTEISESIPGEEITPNQTNTAGSSESIGPETPENERRNKYGGK